MSKTEAFPFIGNILRVLITRTGYRPFVTSSGNDKDLDDLANEARPGSNFNLICEISAQWTDAIADDYGQDWGDLCRSLWDRYLKTSQQIAQKINISSLLPEKASNQFFKLVIVPEISGAIMRASNEFAGVKIDDWWDSPFAAWVDFVSKKKQLDVSVILERIANHLDVDTRTLDIWLAGEPIGISCWPYRRTTAAVLSKSDNTDLCKRDLDRATGWLVMAVAIQSLDVNIREVVKHDFSLKKIRKLKSIEEVDLVLKQSAYDHEGIFIRQRVSGLVDKLNNLFLSFQKNSSEIERHLVLFNQLMNAVPEKFRGPHQFIFDAFSARVSANLEEQDKAVELYKRAVDGAWWYAGGVQHAILHEALCYAVGVGNKVQAEHYWDKCYLLGLNRAPKVELDHQQLRRLSLGFEQMFSPLKAKLHVPPVMEVDFNNQPYSLSSKDLKNPNRQIKFAEGRTRRTPLMNAVLNGTLSDVIALLDAGGDPNNCIKESGEGPFIYAMRRAYDQKDPSIVNHFLTLPLDRETVNRPASTKKETPLQIALEMADAEVLYRLIDMGADIEQKCFTADSAICYALSLLHENLNKDHLVHKSSYIEGITPGDGNDAKMGAVLDVELGPQRQALSVSKNDPWHKNLYAAIESYYFRPTEDRKDIIKVLLESGANANRRYRSVCNQRYLWSPTLFAAEIGELDVFKLMIKAGGDPALTLQSGSTLDHKDAMWVAVTNRNQSVVDFLH